MNDSTSDRPPVAAEGGVGMGRYVYRYVCKTPLGLRDVLVAADSDDEADARFLEEFQGVMEAVLYVEKTLSAERDGGDGAHEGDERRPGSRLDERRRGLAKDLVGGFSADCIAERDRRRQLGHEARGGSRGRRATSRALLALVALAAYAAATLLLYALIVRWPWLMVACLAVARACAALALATAVALLLLRLLRRG